MQRNLALFLFLLCTACQPSVHKQRETLSGMLVYPPPSLPEAPSRQHVEVEGHGLHARVSLALDRAPLEPTLFQLLERARVPFRFELLELPGHRTLRLEHYPLLEACRLLLQESGAFVEWQEHPPLLRIADLSAKPPQRVAHAAPRGKQITVPFSPEHLESARLRKLLSGGIAPDVEVAESPLANRLYLHGSPHAIEQAKRMLRQADQAAPTLHMEWILVSVDQDFQEVETNLSGWLSLRDNTLVYVPEAPFLLSHTTSAAAPPGPESRLRGKAFSERVVGSVISRIENYVESGSTYALDVGRTGYLLATQQFGGVPSGVLQKIATGTLLRVTPTALPGGAVRLILSYEDSGFAVAEFAQELSAAKLLGTLISEIEVPEGSWVQLTGYEELFSAWSQEGPLWVRNLPGSTAFTATSYEPGQSRFSFFLQVKRATPTLERSPRLREAVDEVPF